MNSTISLISNDSVVYIAYSASKRPIAGNFIKAFKISSANSKSSKNYPSIKLGYSGTLV